MTQYILLYLVVGLIIGEASSRASRKVTPLAFIFIVLFWAIMVPIALLIGIVEKFNSNK
jgi:NADH:ubiquinone oxidoreductase subunit 5 (subunit L)/multisubunit Na+/H+ antiporter MnhA subunit